MKFFVTCRDDSWTVSLQALLSELMGRFPACVASKLTNSDVYGLLCDRPAPEVHEIRVHKRGHSLTMEGSITGCAVVAAWFREVIPAEHPVTFYDDNYDASVDVTPGMTAGAIALAYNEAASS